ncbi:hypothetical protein FHETE_1598 [Fusarium heterosporum]|uniref:L-ornithine N(5)-monooxygenase [NAD(P)H] n=1 Tax=Fusarium heterosporum TaxID=42747 RepID=A0A8H5TXP6_FUSHE|nr:hypothetical protein FHETE_1598 [Fusarium heterosporum]
MASVQIEEDIYDVLIIGAGPCGLAISARLHEHTPAALFTDEEHRRFHWISKYGNKMPLKHVRSGKITSPKITTQKPQYKMLVLDADSDTWMGRWNRLFKMYDISHLRSPMLWHVDPLDRDALLAHAYANDREDELVEIRNCVGKEVSKHGRKKSGQRACGRRQEARVDINVRERNDYYNPSTALFCDHCEKVAARYRLGPELIRKEALEHLDYSEVKGVSIDGEKLFTVTSNKIRRYARTVVLAVGPANVAKIPHIPSMPNVGNLPQTCHSMHITEFPDPIIKQRIAARRHTNVLVVGGGLTSAQLSDLALRRGVTKVWHIMRGPLRIKHFDVGLEWMGKFKNAKQAQFYYADSDDERIEMIKEARGGGSITPVFHKRLKKHQAAKRLELLTETSLADASFDAVSGTWSVQTNPPVELPAMDYMYFATGIQTDFSSLPYLRTIMEKYPIEGRGGFPCINNDLMWNEEVPLFMMGRLAALRLGPAAPNLGGAQVGAERVAWAIEDRLPRPGQDESVVDHRKGYLSGHGNIAPPAGSLSWDVLLRPTQPRLLPVSDAWDIRSLSFFHHTVAPFLSGPYDGSFWTYFVAQTTYSEPAVRHTVLAISSLFENFGALPTSKPDVNRFAISHYNKAINILVNDPEPSIDIVLLVCVLFVCLEFLRGNPAAAVTHATHGVQLFNATEDNARLTTTLSNISMFPVFFAKDGEEFPLLRRHTGKTVRDNPVFQDLSEAQHIFGHICIRALRIIRAGSSRLANPMHQKPLEEILSLKREAQDDIETWGAAFERFHATRPEDDRDDSTTVALMMWYRLMKVWLSQCMETSEMGYDAFKDDFAHVIKWARKAAENLENRNIKPAKFIYDPGDVLKLHFTVHRCRYLPLRLEALSLMRRLASEGGPEWDAPLMDDMACRIIEAEHDIDLSGKYDPDDMTLPPDSKRIRGFIAEEAERTTVVDGTGEGKLYSMDWTPVVFQKQYMKGSKKGGKLLPWKKKCVKGAV